MSATGTPRRYQARVGQPANFNLCQRCGAPPAAHDPDWACPSAPPWQVSAIPLVLGINLALAAIIARLVVGSAADAAQAMLLADAFIAGVVLAVAGAVGAGKRHR
jgi:hypothetical protein